MITILSDEWSESNSLVNDSGTSKSFEELFVMRDDDELELMGGGKKGGQEPIGTMSGLVMLTFA